MKNTWHFFRLIRLLNLAVIALTMAVFQVFVFYGDYLAWLHFDFVLLILSTVLIAAAGNIINDYFDVKADRVNKPDLLIIDKYIKRRWAILFNWVFNSVGLLIALYLSWKYKILLLAIIPFICINLLWFYSVYFKRTLILGNVIVAFLTAIVPLYILLFNKHISVFHYHGAIVLIFAGYAFWLNLIREIVKDIADVEGDRLLGSKTLPITFGIKTTRIILIVCYAIGIIPLAYFMYQGISMLDLIRTVKTAYAILTLTTLVIVFMLASMFLLTKNANRSRYLLSANLLKVAMFFGLLIPLFL